MATEEVLAKAEQDYIKAKTKDDKLAFGKLYNRTKENVDKAQPPSDPTEEMYRKYKSMTPVEFLEDLYFSEIGKFCEESIKAGNGHPFAYEVVEVSDEDWDAWEELQLQKKAKKPKLIQRR